MTVIGVRAEAIEQGDGLAGRGRPDVAALGVGDERDVAGTAARSRSRAAIPAEPNASKNARFGLTAAAYGQAASTSRPANRFDAGEVRREAGRQAAGSGSRPRQRTRADRRRPRREPLEVGAPVTGRRRRRGLATRRPTTLRAPAVGGRAARSARDEPARPRRTVEARDLGQVESCRLTVQSGAVPSSRASSQVDDLARGCGGTRSRRRPATRPAPRSAPSLVTRRTSLAAGRVEDHDVRAEAARPGRRDVPAVRARTTDEVAGPGQRRGLLRGRRRSDRSPARPSRPSRPFRT